jgi:hypothetical protein
MANWALASWLHSCGRGFIEGMKLPLKQMQMSQNSKER